MEITAVESLFWSSFPRLLQVRVHTDSGLVGIGETVDKVQSTRAAVHEILAPRILGRDPLDIESIWHSNAEFSMYHGYAGAEMRALSAIDVALWDLMGRYYDAPLFSLLGGKVRERVPICNTCSGFDQVDDYARWQRDAGSLAKELLGQGIRAMKIWPFDRFSGLDGGQSIALADIESAVEPMRRIRDAVGLEMEIGLEMHFRWTRAAMERILPKLEEFDLLFLEDPLGPWYPDEIKELTRKTSIPIVGSEMLMTRWQLREWLENHVSQIVMTEPLWTGGVSETRKIASMAEAFGMPLMLHNIAGPVGHAVCMHLGVHLPNLYFAESVRAFWQTYFPILSNIEPTVVDGKADVPAGPGLGVDLSESALARSDLQRIVTDDRSQSGESRKSDYERGFTHMQPE